MLERVQELAVALEAVKGNHLLKVLNFLNFPYFPYFPSFLDSLGLPDHLIHPRSGRGETQRRRRGG